MTQLRNSRAETLTMSFTDRTGHPGIDKIIESLIQCKQFSRYRDPHCADGECFFASEDVVRYFRNAGLEAWVPQAVQSDQGSEEHWELTPELFGYSDRPVEGWPTHYWACVQTDTGVVYGIDFTASQYGYTDLFPMIQKGTANNLWALKRVPQHHLIEPSEIELIRNDIRSRAYAALA